MQHQRPAAWLPYEKNPVDWGQMARRGVYALPALMLPVFVLVGLRFGFATPTEISTFAVVYSIVVSSVIYRDMTWERITRSLVFAGAASGVVLLLIMGSSCAGWIMTLEQIPERFIEWAQGSIHSQVGVLALMNLLMLFAGMFIDLPAAILLLGPLFVPLANAYHIDLIQLGVMMVVNLAIGLYSPPVGTTLFIGSMLAKASIGQTVKELLPFYGVGLIVLGMMTYIPAMTLRF
ncbi:TRAP transporter large permease subunit [Propionivibrio sp.]|uniref:TRAP transporter large permease subunit n=1 Tax=Propionivibrio sp. TaxID=2212460 RepID=UPI00272EA10F|nr:TRAP transporter large permease subunit [Propionivibrio sp.]